jgi:hypothetical protein
MQQIANNINKSQRSRSPYALTPRFQLTNPTMFAGEQLQDKSREWLSPEDPSTNYNIARKAYHDGTATWFIQGTTFREWEMTGSLLWIHGIRMYFPTLRLYLP